MFQPFNNEQPCPQRPAAMTAQGVKVYYSDYVISNEFPQEVKAVYKVCSDSFEPRSDLQSGFRWAGCVVNATSQVQQSSPEGYPAVRSGFDTEDGHYFLVTEDDSDHMRFKDCIKGEGHLYRIVRNFIQGSEKIGHEIVELTFDSSGEVVRADVDVYASDYSQCNHSSSPVHSPVDFSENINEIEEISERLENLRAQVAGEESRLQKLREFFALAAELGYSVVKTESPML